MITANGGGGAGGGVSRKRQRGSLFLPVVILLVLPLAIGFLVRRPPGPFLPEFSGPDRLVTNERAYHRPDMPGVVRSDDWLVTSGSLFARDGHGWTGEPDEILPDAKSSNGTGSAIFRVVSARDDFQDVMIVTRLRVEDVTETAGRHVYDGAHLFVRYQGPEHFYGITLFRRDGQIMIKRKSPGRDGQGRYVTLAAVVKPLPLHTWVDVAVRVVTLNSGSVRISVWVDNTLTLLSTDRGRRGEPIRDAGRVGLRGDNCQFSFDAFRAEPIP